MIKIEIDNRVNQTLKSLSSDKKRDLAFIGAICSVGVLAEGINSGSFSQTCGHILPISTGLIATTAILGIGTKSGLQIVRRESTRV